VSTIRETVETVMHERGLGHYLSHAEPVIEALTEREYGITDSLRESAAAIGIDAAEVEDAIADSGLAVRPVAQPEAIEGGDVQQQIASLAEDLRTLASTVNQALEAARRQGVRI
jgi:hypothetical protein